MQSNKELLQIYEQDKKESDKPYKRWLVMRGYNWVTCKQELDFNSDFQYKRKNDSVVALEELQDYFCSRGDAEQNGNCYIVVGASDYQDKNRVKDALSRLHKKKKIDTIVINNFKGVAEFSREWAIQNDVSWIAYNVDEYKHSAAKVNTDMLNHLTSLANENMDNVGAVAFNGDADVFDMIMKCNHQAIKVWEVDK